LSHFGPRRRPTCRGRELKGSGLLDGWLPPALVAGAVDDPALREDEDPLEPGDLDLGLAPRPEPSGEE
jgi:segregation and condensation protein B